MIIIDFKLNSVVYLSKDIKIKIKEGYSCKNCLYYRGGSCKRPEIEHTIIGDKCISCSCYNRTDAISVILEKIE